MLRPEDITGVILVGGTGRAFLNVNTIKEYEAILGRKKHGH